MRVLKSHPLSDRIVEDTLPTFERRHPPPFGHSRVRHQTLLVPTERCAFLNRKHGKSFDISIIYCFVRLMVKAGLRVARHSEHAISSGGFLLVHREPAVIGSKRQVALLACSFESSSNTALRHLTGEHALRQVQTITERDVLPRQAPASRYEVEVLGHGASDGASEEQLRDGEQELHDSPALERRIEEKTQCRTSCRS